MHRWQIIKLGAVSRIDLNFLAVLSLEEDLYQGTASAVPSVDPILFAS
jgi:hypothetical protein